LLLDVPSSLIAPSAVRRVRPWTAGLGCEPGNVIEPPNAQSTLPHLILFSTRAFCAADNSYSSCPPLRICGMVVYRELKEDYLTNLSKNIHLSWKENIGPEKWHRYLFFQRQDITFSSYLFTEVHLPGDDQ